MRRAFMSAAVLLAVIAIAFPVMANEKLVIGWIEKVRLYPGGLVIHAKIDTGARTASLNAQNIKTFGRNGSRWVRFSVTNRSGDTYTFEREIIRYTKIKDLDGASQKRPVIRLGVCLGKTYLVTGVNLVDRTGFNYQMLIGRRILRRMAIVDPSKRYTTVPECPKAPKLAN